MAGFIILMFILLFLSGTNSRLVQVLSFSILFILSAFRDISVGTDTKGYLMLFDRLEKGGEIRQEYLWQLLNKAVIFFHGNFGLLLIISTLLVLVPVYWVSQKHSKFPNFSIFLFYSLYFYLFSFNITRQSIAVSIILIALLFLLENNKKMFFFMVIVAAGFHITAILSLALLLTKYLPSRSGDKVYYILSLITIAIGMFFSERIFKFMGDMLGYGRYVDTFEMGTILGNFLYLLILNSFLFFAMKVSTERGVLFKLFFAFIIITNLSIRIPFGDRFIMYFSIVQILYLPMLLDKCRVRPKEIVGIIVVIYAIVMFFRKLGAGDIFPYSNTLF